MKLNSQTLQAVENLRKMNWFSNVGSSIPEMRIKRCLNWEQAVLSCQTNLWGSISSTNSNTIYAYLLDFPSSEQIELYETSDIEISGLVPSLGDLAVRKLNLDEHSKQSIRTRLTWDIAHYLHCIELSSILTKTFSYEIGDWYLRGHFPCGWHGVFPVGDLVVF